MLLLPLRVSALRDRVQPWCMGYSSRVFLHDGTVSGKCYPIKYISSVGLCRAKPSKMFLFHRNARLPVLRGTWRVAWRKAWALIGLDCKSHGSYSMSRYVPQFRTTSLLALLNVIARIFRANEEFIRATVHYTSVFFFFFTILLLYYTF